MYLPLFATLAQRSLILTRALSLIDVEVIRKKFRYIPDILILQRGSNSFKSFLLTTAKKCYFVWQDKSLQWWFHHQRLEWLESSEIFTCQNYELPSRSEIANKIYVHVLNTSVLLRTVKPKKRYFAHIHQYRIFICKYKTFGSTQIRPPRG